MKDFRVHGMCIDAGGLNHGYFLLLGRRSIAGDHRVSILHPLDSSRKIFLWYCMTHIMKAVRNQHNKSLDSGTRNLLDEFGKSISWRCDQGWEKTFMSSIKWANLRASIVGFLEYSKYMLGRYSEIRFICALSANTSVIRHYFYRSYLIAGRVNDIEEELFGRNQHQLGHSISSLRDRFTFVMTLSAPCSTD